MGVYSTESERGPINKHICTFHLGIEVKNVWPMYEREVVMMPPLSLVNGNDVVRVTRRGSGRGQRAPPAPSQTCSAVAYRSLYLEMQPPNSAGEPYFVTSTEPLASP